MRIFKNRIQYVFITLLIIFSTNYLKADNDNSKTVQTSTTFYVSKSGNDSNSGKSWQYALQNIRTALLKAASGDSIWISSGTYIEGNSISINSGVSLFGGFIGNETNIDDRDTSVNKTIIDGERKYCCVINSGTIDGLYIQNGRSSSEGGGCYNSGIVNNCIIINNKVHNTYNKTSGGGIYNNSGIISNCIIENNTSSSGYNYTESWENTTYGGGIYNVSGKVINCIVMNNLSEAYSYAFSLSYYAYANASTIGGGVYNNSGNIENCTITRNNLHTYAYSINNQAYTTSSGAGVYNDSGSIDNCIIWGNYSSDYELDNQHPGNISYSCYPGAYTNNNINMDPKFIYLSDNSLDSADLHLDPNSPCIDAGKTLSINSDKDGIQRPQGMAWDMGCYEYYIKGDTNADCILDIIDIQNLSKYLCNSILFSRSQKFISDYNRDGKIDISDIVSIVTLLNKQNKNLGQSSD